MNMRSLWGISRRMYPVVVVATVFLLPWTSEGQAPDGEACVRVAGRHTNVHTGPSSGQPVLVLVPEGTVLRVTDRRGEWLGVRLTPDLRETGLVMRWYRNEDRGYLHQSTVADDVSCEDGSR